MSTSERSAGELLYDAFVNATQSQQPERRGSVRKPWIAQVTVSWHTAEPGSVEAATNDLSPQGFGLFTNQDVPTGTAVVTRFDSLPGRPRIGGVDLDVSDVVHHPAVIHRADVPAGTAHKRHVRVSRVGGVVDGKVKSGDRRAGLIPIQTDVRS